MESAAAFMITGPATKIANLGALKISKINYFIINGGKCNVTKKRSASAKGSRSFSQIAQIQVDPDRKGIGGAEEGKRDHFGKNYRKSMNNNI